MQVGKDYAIGPDGTVVMLSPREREVLLYVAAGVGHDVLHAALQIERRTVNDYVSKLCTAIGAANRREVGAWAILTGMVAVEEIWAVWRQYAPGLAVWRAGQGEGVR